MSRVSEIRVHRRRCLQQAVNSHELFWLQPEGEPSRLDVYTYAEADADAAGDGPLKLRPLASVPVPSSCTVKQVVAISPAPEFRVLWAVVDCAIESNDEDVVVVGEQSCVAIMAVDTELAEMTQLDIITGVDQLGDVIVEQSRFGTAQEVKAVEDLVVQILRVHGEELVLDEVLVTDKGPDLRRSVAFTNIAVSNLTSTCIGQDHVLVATGELVTVFNIDGGGRQAFYTLEGGEEVWRLMFQPVQLLGRFTPNLIYVWAVTPHNLHLLAAKIGNQVNEFVRCGAVPLDPFVPPQAKTVLALRNVEILSNSLGDGAAMLLHVFHEGTLLVHGLDLRRVLRAAELMRRTKKEDPPDDLKPAYQLEELFRAELQVADIEQAFSTPHSLCTYGSGMINDQSGDLSFEVRVLRQHGSSSDYAVEVWRVDSPEQQLVDFLREHTAEALANPKVPVPFELNDAQLFKQCTMLINPLRHAAVGEGGWSVDDGRRVCVYEAMLNAGLAHLICIEVERGSFDFMGLLKLWVTRVKADLVTKLTKPGEDEIGVMLLEFLFSGKLNRMRDFPMAWGLYLRSLTALSEGCSLILHALWERACADVADAAMGEHPEAGMAALNRHLLEVTALLACVRLLVALCEHVNFIYDHHKVRQLHARRVEPADVVQELGPTFASACQSHQQLFDKVLRLWGVDLGGYPPSDPAELMAIIFKPLLQLLQSNDKKFAHVPACQQVYLHCWAAVFYFVLDVFSTTTPRHTISAAREVMHNSGLPTGWQQLVEVLWSLDRGYPIPDDVDVYALLSGNDVLELLDSEIYDAVIVQLCRTGEFDVAYRLMRRNPPQWNEQMISLFTACASRSLPAQAVRRAYNDICRTVPANSRSALKARAVTVLCEAPAPSRWANLKQLVTAPLDDEEAEAVATHMDGLLDEELRGGETDFPVAKLLISFMLFRRRIEDASRIVNRLQQARGAAEPTTQQLAALVDGYTAAANGSAQPRPAATTPSSEALTVPVTPNRKWRRTSTDRSQSRTPQRTAEPELETDPAESPALDISSGNQRVAFDVSPAESEDRPRQRYARTPFAFAPHRRNGGNDYDEGDDQDGDPADEQEPQAPEEPDSPMNIADRVFPRSAIKTPGTTRRNQRQAVHFADDY